MNNNNNKKYKINMKGLLLGLGGTVSVIAPVATLVACGGSSESKESNTPNFTGKQTMTIDDSDIKALPQNLSPYSVSELFADATKYGDKSMWNRGVAIHSLGSAVSFIKNLAEAYGWDRHDYATKNGITVIDSTNESKSDIVASTDAKYLKVEALRDINVKNSPFTDAQKRDLYFETGDDGTWGDYNSQLKQQINYKNGGYTLINVENKNFKHEYKGNGNHTFTSVTDANKVASINFAAPGGAYYADSKNPGNVTAVLYDKNDKLSRIVSLPDAFDKYAILSDAYLRDEIAPYAKALIEKFLQMFQGQRSLASSFIMDETLDQIDYLIEQNTMSDPVNPAHKTFKIDNAKFNQKLKELNNGSTHWLAIKTFFRGLDNSFLTGGFETYNGFSGAPTAFEGISTMSSVYKLQDWAHFNQTGNSLGLSNFVAGMTLDEMDKFNGQEATRVAQLEQLIKNSAKYLETDTSVNKLWVKFDTTGKTFHEVAEQIQLNQLLEKESKYLLADTSTNALWTKFDWSGKTLQEIQAQLALNKLLDSSVKYLLADTSANKLWTKFDWSGKTFNEIKAQVDYNKLLDTSIKYLLADTSANAMWTKFDWVGKTLTEIQEIVTRNKFIESSIKYLLADTSTNALWTKFDWSSKNLDEIKVVVEKNKFIDNSANKKYLLADVNGKWQTTTSLETKTLDELKAIVSLHKVLEQFDKKYIAKVDLTKPVVEVADALLWEKYKDVNAAEVASALTAKHLTSADLDTHKVEIQAQVLQTFIDGLKAKGTLLVTSTDAELNAFKDGDKWDQSSHPIVKQTADYTKIKNEMLRLSGSTLYGNIANDARAFIFHSFDATTITASFEYTIKVGGVVTHHSHNLTFYRHI